MKNKRICLTFLKLVFLVFIFLLVRCQIDLRIWDILSRMKSNPLYDSVEWVSYLPLSWVRKWDWIVGLICAVRMTRPEWKISGRKSVYLVFVVIVYALLTVSMQKVFIDQKSYRYFEMTWIDNGTVNNFQKAHIVLDFSDYPGNYLGIYSNELANYLHQTSEKTIDVRLEISSDLGCLHGLQATQIGELTHWDSWWSYADVEGPSSPFVGHWWCHR